MRFEKKHPNAESDSAIVLEEARAGNIRRVSYLATSAWIAAACFWFTSAVFT